MSALAPGEVRGAREGVGAVIGDGVLDPRLQDGLFGVRREEMEVGQPGARTEGVERRPTWRWTLSREGEFDDVIGGGGQRGLTSVRARRASRVR